MRIALLAWSFPVLSETFVVNLATGLIDRGHHVDLISLLPRPHDGSPMHPAVETYRLIERTRYPDPRTLGLRRLRPAAVRWALQQTARSVGLFRQAAYCVRYGRRALSQNPALLSAALASLPPYDIVHCQFADLAFYAAMLRDSGCLQPRMVTSLRGFDISAYVQRHGPKAHELLFRSGDFFLSVCDYFRRRAIGLGCDPRRIETHHSGIDIAKYAFRTRPLANGGVHIVSVGRLIEKKGLDFALDAVAASAPHLANFRYTIVGDGPLRGELKARTVELGIAERVTFTGSLPQDRVNEMLQSSDVFLGPSVTASSGEEDGITNTLKEAMAVGLPVVATRHAGIPELVEDGVSGFLVPERDAGALAERLRFLVTHPERWPEMGLAGRRRVRGGVRSRAAE